MPVPKFCSACGSPSGDSMQFCTKCGRQFPMDGAPLLPGSAAAQPRVGGDGGTRLSAAELAAIQHPSGTSKVHIHIQGQYGAAGDVVLRSGCYNGAVTVATCFFATILAMQIYLCYLLKFYINLEFNDFIQVNGYVTGLCVLLFTGPLLSFAGMVTGVVISCSHTSPNKRWGFMMLTVILLALMEGSLQYLLDWIGEHEAIPDVRLWQQWPCFTIDGLIVATFMALLCSNCC